MLTSKISQNIAPIALHISNRASHLYPDDINQDYLLYKKNRARNNFLSLNQQQSSTKEMQPPAVNSDELYATTNFGMASLDQGQLLRESVQIKNSNYNTLEMLNKNNFIVQNQNDFFLMERQVYTKRDRPGFLSFRENRSKDLK